MKHHQMEAELITARTNHIVRSNLSTVPSLGCSSRSKRPWGTVLLIA